MSDKVTDCPKTERFCAHEIEENESKAGAFGYPELEPRVPDHSSEE